MDTTGHYQDCYVAFLDILGFRHLVERSVGSDARIAQLSGITTLAATPKSGVKQTSLGPCWMQVRAFSDSIVVFTPANQQNANACSPLTQLCFIARHLHDRILELDACVRGGIARGPMFWHPSWSRPNSKPKRGSRGALSITFGPGLNAAYDLEQRAVFPRVLVDEGIIAQSPEVACWPFANHGASLGDCLRRDPVDNKVHLDLLDVRVVRSAGETMHTSPGGLTVTWKNGGCSSHGAIVNRAQALAEAGVEVNATCERVKQKYEWLLAYSGTRMCPSEV